MQRIRFAVTTAIATCAFAGMAAAPAAQAANTVVPASPSASSAVHGGLAAGKCWKDNNGKNQWWCHNAKGARLYKEHSNGLDPIDRIRTNPSYFVCKSDNGDNHGGPHPTRWLLAQGDDHGRTGWVSDNDIVDETDPVRTCVTPDR